VRPSGGHAVALHWTMKHLYGVEPGEVWIFRSVLDHGVNTHNIRISILTEVFSIKCFIYEGLFQRANSELAQAIR
jgi:propionyl-CoA synthetase